MVLKRILVVEDDRLLSTLSGMFIDELGYELAGRYQSGEEALRDLEELKPDMVLMDIQIKGPYNGIETARLLREKKRIPIVFITGDLQNDAIEEIISGDFYGYLRKPFTKAIFDEAIKFARVKHEREEAGEKHALGNGAAAIIRQNGYISFANKAFKDFFHIENQDYIRKPMRDYLMQDIRDDFSEAIDNSFINNVALKPFTFNQQHVAGKFQMYHFTGALIYFENEKSLYLSVA